MLRLIVLVLLLANGVYYAWAQGFMLPWGVGPAQQSEPQRLAQQVKPETLRILKGDEAARVDAAVQAAKPAECLVAGPFPDAQVATLKTALETWPVASWTLEPESETARWIVYMGKYLSADHVNRKKAELRQLGISFETLANPTLEPGLSLGGFPTEADATRHLEALAERGVRTARVVQERAEVKGQRLQLSGLDDALRARLDTLKPALAGKPLRPCR